jgi:hypothetical protein
MAVARTLQSACSDEVSVVLRTSAELLIVHCGATVIYLTARYHPLPEIVRS